MATTDFRPKPTFLQSTAFVVEEEFVFSRHPILHRPEIEISSDIDSGDETDPEDHETRIRSSWHHRALLGDEDRILYNDFKDTDFEEIEKQIELKDRLETTEDTVMF